MLSLYAIDSATNKLLTTVKTRSSAKHANILKLMYIFNKFYWHYILSTTWKFDCITL